MSFRLKGTAALISSGSSSEAKVGPLLLNALPSRLMANFLIEQPDARASRSASVGNRIKSKRTFMAGESLCAPRGIGKPASRLPAMKGASHFLTQVKPDEPPHPSPRPSPL